MADVIPMTHPGAKAEYEAISADQAEALERLGWQRKQSDGGPGVAKVTKTEATRSAKHAADARAEAKAAAKEATATASAADTLSGGHAAEPKE